MKMERKNLLFVVGMIMFLISGIGLGIVGTRIYDLINYEDNNYKGSYDGLRFESNDSHISAIQTARTYDGRGDWICVNVKGMKYERAIEVCNHEVGHEIFAEVCEKNITKCMNTVEK